VIASVVLPGKKAGELGLDPVKDRRVGVDGVVGAVGGRGDLGAFGGFAENA
jgi:hypothetical protein